MTLAPAGRPTQDRSDRRAVLLAFPLLLALATAVCGGGAWSPGRVLGVEGGDIALQFIAWREFGFDALRRGDLAFWNPHVYGGAPFLGGFQSALLYPLNALHLLLPAEQAINATLILHVALAGWFMTLWARSRGAGAMAATVAGALFMLSGPYFPHVFAGHLPHVAVMAWAPLLFMSLDRLDRGAAMAWALPGSLAMAMMILAGHPQYVYYAALVALAYVAACAPRAASPRRLLGGAALVGVGGAALSAAQWLPGLEAAAESVRAAGTPPAFARMFALPPENLLTLLAPEALGRLLAPGAPGLPYFGRWYLWEASHALGATGALLAAAGIVMRTPATRLPAAMAAGCLLVAMGRYTPLYDALERVVPMFDGFRGVSKFACFAAMFLCLAAAMGLDAARAAAPPRAMRRATWVAVALLGCGGAALWIEASNAATGWWRRLLDAAARSDVYLDPNAYADPSFVRAAAAHSAGALLVAGATLSVASLLLRRAHRGRGVALAALAVAEIAFFASRQVATSDAAGDLDPAMRAAWSALPQGQRLFAPQSDLANAGMRIGRDNAWGYDPMVLRRYAEYAAAAQGIDASQSGQYLPSRRIAPPMLRALGVGLVVLDGPPRALASIPDALPRAWAVREVVVEPRGEAALRRLAEGAIDPARTVILESAPGLAITPGPPQQARFRAVDSDTVGVDAALQAPAVLVIGNAFSRGWRCVDGLGREHAVVPAMHALQAVALPAGEHRLRLTYRPRTWPVAAGASILGVAGHLGWGAALLVRARRSGLVARSRAREAPPRASPRAKS